MISVQNFDGRCRNMKIFSHFLISITLLIDITGSSTLSPPQVQLQRVQHSQLGKHLASSTPFIAQCLLNKYRGRLIHCKCEEAPLCDIFLCGTLHVSPSSVHMVRDVITSLRPDNVVLELCPSRAETLFDHDPPAVQLRQVLGHALRTRSSRNLGMGLLCWMQSKAARLTQSNLGGEQQAAAQAAQECRAQVILGDRHYEVTMQRIFDRLNMWNKLQMCIIVMLEALTMNLQKLSTYIRRTESEVGFAEEEIRQFMKYLPRIAEIIITERDLYLAQSIRNAATSSNITNTTLVAVVGAGHLPGIRRHLALPRATDEMMRNISKSSKHAPMWPGDV